MNRRQFSVQKWKLQAPTGWSPKTESVAILASINPVNLRSFNGDKMSFVCIVGSTYISKFGLKFVYTLVVLHIIVYE